MRSRFVPSLLCTSDAFISPRSSLCHVAHRVCPAGCFRRLFPLCRSCALLPSLFVRRASRPSLVFSRLPEVVLRSRYILRSLRHNRRGPSFSFPCSVVISISRSLHVSGSPAAHPHCFARPYFSFSWFRPSAAIAPRRPLRALFYYSAWYGLMCLSPPPTNITVNLR